MSCEDGDSDDIPPEAYSLLHKIANQWTGIVNAEELVLKILQGSMTNRVYECHWSWEDGHCPKKVLVRIYGNGANLLFERENEVATFERMSQLGHGPRLLGRFPNGRLEEFLDARDYEYASYNPVAFDIANHFCEMMADYHTETPHLLDQKKYPDFAERQRFVECYLKVSGKGDDCEVENLMKDIDHYVLASHIHWGLWGILSANVAEINFDYLGYARERFKLYYEHDF